jgi:hypothetical protein
LKKSYELLHGLGNPLGESYLRNKRISGLLKQRNDSFLAHGTKPITSEACQSLFDESRILLRNVLPNFDQLSKELQFPWESIKQSDWEKK